MSEKIKLIVVAGGIGCGKSVVCSILSAMGYAVYDCDSRAKTIMNESRDIIDRIAEDICREAVIEDDRKQRVIDRKRLAKEVFNDVGKLKKLNRLVHHAVEADILLWRDTIADRGYMHDTVFVETALLKQSGLDQIADTVWEVSAPMEIRVQRAMMRDKCDRAAIEARIKSQEITAIEAENTSVQTTAAPTWLINNDGQAPLLPQINRLLTLACSR